MNSNDETKPSFFCVPDITGFTKFIAEAEISFSKRFISNLLNKLISANILNMNVAEIEGDAIFFYKTGRLPAFKRVVKQCEGLYQTFQNYLLQIKSEDPENYERHLASGGLGLKIIIHCGSITTTNIKGRIKLIGEDVIIVHKLLKNKIKEEEYLLFTEAYLKKIRKSRASVYFDLQSMKRGKEIYDYIGEVGYGYLPVADLGLRQPS